MNRELSESGRILSEKLREILDHLFEKKGITPDTGEFDALADDIEDYIENSLEEFILFYKERQQH